NEEFTKDSHVSTAARPTSPGNLLLPGQAANRSRSRPKAQLHHFAAPATTSECVPATDVNDNNRTDPQEETPLRDTRKPTYQPQTPPRCSSRLARNPQYTPQKTSDDHPSGDKQPHKNYLTKPHVLSDEPFPDGEANHPLANSKIIQVSSSVEHAREQSDTEAVPTLDNLPKTKVCHGLIPQDIVKSMDPKDIKKAISATVIASRIYNIMSPEQLDTLKKERDELEQFVESMNVSLLIEIRMRDASVLLIRQHENGPNLDALKAATIQFQATAQKMDSLNQAIQETMWRLMTIQRLLLQHEGGILNAGLRQLDSENRELTRAVLQLDNAKDQEKEEKIKWKREHNRLKFQSILFPSTPTYEEFTIKAPPSPGLQKTQQEHQTQLTSMEQYVKELSDEILQKDETLTELKSQLEVVRGWAGDFQHLILGRRSKHTGADSAASDLVLQRQLYQLQSSVEGELKDMDILLQEQRAKVEALVEENADLVVRSNSGLPSGTFLASDEEFLLDSELTRARRAQRSARTKTHSRQGPGLHMILHESLQELDRQIQSASSNRSSSASTSLTSFSTDSCETEGTALSWDPSNHFVGGYLSRTHSNCSSQSNSSLGLREQVPRRDFIVEDA
ncbi:hypothetical protein BC939DRAFT_312187, partial [Gamsiella multidivaricata]|uniref:uncharacterized protein n=1 Tax=Gamsiella multidivaricata TaxID=101098 RepID=UPI00221E642E